MKESIIKAATIWYNLLENGVQWGNDYAAAYDAFADALTAAGIYTHTDKDMRDMAKRVRNHPEILDDLLDRAQRCSAFVVMLEHELAKNDVNGYLGATTPDPDDENSHWQSHFWQGRVFLVCIDGFGVPVRELCECYTLQEVVRQPQNFLRFMDKQAFDRLRLQEYQVTP